MRDFLKELKRREGVYRDLLTRLSNISDLRVISRRSADRYREGEKAR